jgi:hypothetical protein
MRRKHSRLNMSIQAALSVCRFVLQRFTITTVLKPGRQKYHLRNCKKWATINTACDVRKQHSQSEMKAILITIQANQG